MEVLVQLTTESRMPSGMDTILPASLLQPSKQNIVYLLAHTLTLVYSGTQILIHSFAFYIENAVAALLRKGAIPIISSQTPDNIWTNGAIAAPNRFVTYAQSIGIRRNITYVNHYAYTASAYNALGQTQTTTFYPNDHLHTNSAGALVVAEAFVRGLLCGNNSLKAKVNSAGQSVPGVSVQWVYAGLS